ncbi:MAG: tetratricopeptide repeat protein [Prolixibacteraceae bacterium]|nr:tetratricopeptide repeat protein [Prolixibacteraceae bacterium]
MKHLSIFLSLVVLSTIVFAQRGKVTSALGLKESGEIKKAFETIEIAVDSTNPKAERSLSWPRTWEVRGQILQDIYRKNIEGLINEPLFEAYNSYKRAIELDEKQQLSKSLLIDLTLLQTDLSDYAINSYNKEEYETAVKCFEIYLDINNLPIMQSNADVASVDTAIIFNTGLAAFKAKNYNKAIKYFNEAIKYNYNSESCYFSVYNAYQAMGDTLASLNVLKEGFEKHPNNEILNVELINYYILTENKPEEALKFIDMAIERKPDNATLYAVKGKALDQMGRYDEAIEIYKKSIEIDPEQFRPQFNLSAIYFNQGVEIINAAIELPLNETDKYDAEIEKAKEYFKKSLPYIEKAYSIDSTQIDIMESLRTIYLRLDMTEKYNNINEKIKSLKKE